MCRSLEILVQRHFLFLGRSTSTLQRIELYIGRVPVSELIPTGDSLPLEQQRSIGHKIGLFVAWLEVNCSARYDRLASPPRQFDLTFPEILDKTFELFWRNR